ncbi:DinB family protein [Luedemannella helvata]|uniref:DinB family protein n=1 Tax=Luedemannella helvata TaxID=349315 RepID=A0ABP4WMI1_9ACTN
MPADIPWTAPPVERRNEPLVADERAMLEGWLTWQRDTLLWKCAGLTGEQLALASVEPSNLTLLGLVRHMAEVERVWFRIRSAGQDVGPLFLTPDNDDADLTDGTPASAEADFAAFRRECDLADEAAAGLPLEHTFPSPRSGKPISLRWVYVHMIEEYARHNGHADLIRERIDGSTGD